MPRPTTRALCRIGLAVSLATFLAGEGRGAEKCRAKVSNKTGAIEVNASNVAANPRWGAAAGQEVTSFFNAATCVDTADGALRGCNLADPTTLAGRMPPESCDVFIADDGPLDCTAYVRGCTPGVRGLSGTAAAFFSTLSLADGGTTVRITGVNLQVVDGSGSTGGPPTGRGNVIVGYNEDAGAPNDRSGSHNVVVGPDHGFGSYGGLVAGRENTISGPFATVTGGALNVASGSYASVSAGRENTAAGDSSSVSGGARNTANGYTAAISGGYLNVANGESDSISGGRGNYTNGEQSTVTGGLLNRAVGTYATVSGGWDNEMGGYGGSVTGGAHNHVPAPYGDGATVSGGTYNSARGFAASVTGGKENVADEQYASVTGGLRNEARGIESHVSGGADNVVQSGGRAAAIAGGRSNTAGGNYASVGGGRNNSAAGAYASVSGGNGVSAPGTDEWHAGASAGHPTFGPPFGPGVY